MSSRASPRALQRAPRGGHRTDPHDAAGPRRPRPTPTSPAERREAVLLRIAPARQHQCSRAIADTRGVARGHHAVLPEVRRQLGQALQGRVGTHVLVGGPGPGLACLPVLERDRHDLVGKVTAGPGLSGARLAQRCDAVHRLPPEPVLLAQVLRGLGHGESAAARRAPPPRDRPPVEAEGRGGAPSARRAPRAAPGSCSRFPRPAPPPTRRAGSAAPPEPPPRSPIRRAG